MLNTIQLSRVDLNLLVLFDVVLAEGHVGRAAERLSLTPSAVSHGLARLRRLLGDPLFLRTPRGVVPTAQAAALAPAIGDALARVSGVLVAAERFDPARSQRRFAIGAPDAIAAVVLPRLLALLRERAPGVDLGVTQLLPVPGARSARGFWEPTLALLESRTLDLALSPLYDMPARFAAHALYEEAFVIVGRIGHPFVQRATLERFCASAHALVSGHGDPYGFIDERLARLGRSRRIALTAPSFMTVLAWVADTDLLAAVPRGLAAAHAGRYGLRAVELPRALVRGVDRIGVIAAKAALGDTGLAWLFELLRGCIATQPGSRRARPSRAS
jgi:DNA-binding transcriptional LysR family regulator